MAGCGVLLVLFAWDSLCLCILVFYNASGSRNDERAVMRGIGSGLPPSKLYRLYYWNLPNIFLAVSEERGVRRPRRGIR